MTENISQSGTHICIVEQMGRGQPQTDTNTQSAYYSDESGQLKADKPG